MKENPVNGVNTKKSENMAIFRIRRVFPTKIDMGLIINMEKCSGYDLT